MKSSPLDAASFETIIEGCMPNADKTEFVRRLPTENHPYFRF